MKAQDNGLLGRIAVAHIALVIALLSLALSGYNSCVVRRHEYLFTQPILLLNFYHTETGAGWMMANKGLGLPRIRGFRALFDGNKLHMNNMSDVPDVLLPFGFPPNTKIGYLNPYAGTVVEANSKPNSVLWITQDPAVDILLKQNARLTFEVCYCSIYDECWLSSTRDLESKRDDTCSTFSDEPHSNWWKG